MEISLVKWVPVYVSPDMFTLYIDQQVMYEPTEEKILIIWGNWYSPRMSAINHISPLPELG